MLWTARTIVGAAGVLLFTALASHAADLNKAVSDAEGRKRAAENGLKEIKIKSTQPSEQIRAAYNEAATRQNAWLETVCQAVEQGDSVGPRRVDSGRDRRYDSRGMGKRAEPCARTSGNDRCHRRQREEIHSPGSARHRWGDLEEQPWSRRQKADIRRRNAEGTSPLEDVRGDSVTRTWKQALLSQLRCRSRRSTVSTWHVAFRTPNP